MSRTLSTRSDIHPIHLPKIFTDDCVEGKACIIGSTTVTQQIYATLDSFDTGFYETSASELRVKLKSRQSMWLAAGRSNVNFTETDEIPSLCAEINQKAYDWALKAASPTAR